MGLEKAKKEVEKKIIIGLFVLIIGMSVLEP